MKFDKRVEVNIPTKYGDFRVAGFEDEETKEHHIAIFKGDITRDEGIKLRIHSECYTGDVLGSKRCDCREQLLYALAEIEKEGIGAVLYMRQEGRGIGLINKLKAYELQDKGLDTVEANVHLGFDADLRDYSLSAEMIRILGIKRVKLLTNNPKKIEGLLTEGIEVINREPILIKPNKCNERYLKTKKEKLNHLLEL